ncbi:MAG: SusC/RagA family TonB-linked outer membrane protein, partial [Tannerellaceae bacterium]
YGYLTDGLFQTAEEVAQSPVLNKNVKPGDLKYRDISGPDGVPDGKISPDYDRVLLGGSMPRFTYGGRLSVGYKGLDLSMTFQGVGKQNARISTMMMQPLRENWGNIPALIDGNYWSQYNTDEQNQNAMYPRLSYAQAASNYAMSDYWLFSGRYFRLKNITLSYIIPKSITEKAMIDQLRVYVSANDLFSIDKYPQGWDPEMGSSAYPITRSFMFGFSVNF